MQKLIEFLKQYDVPFKINIASKDLCFYGGGGKIALGVYPSTVEHLQNIYKIIEKTETSYHIFGGFSNTLVCDDGYNGLAIFTDSFKGLWQDDLNICCGSAERLGIIAKFALSNSLTGFEPLSGIPSFLGGAVVMNAGAFGTCISELLINVIVFNLKTGLIETYECHKIPFKYRTSGNFFSDKIIISATIKLKMDDKLKIAEKTKEFNKKRQKTQPKEKSLGSVFKNGDALASGYYIERAGLKGHILNGAKISEKHANFIVNTGHGTANDYINLVNLAKKCVFEKYGVKLTEEIIIL